MEKKRRRKITLIKSFVLPFFITKKAIPILRTIWKSFWKAYDETSVDPIPMDARNRKVNEAGLKSLYRIKRF